MKKLTWKKSLAGLLIFCMLLFSSCSAVSGIVSGTSATDSGSPSSVGEIYTASEAATALDAEADKVTITGDFTVTTEVENGYVQSGNVYTITAAGEYTLSGSLPEGQVVVEAGDEDEVTLILNTVSITCSTDSPIYLKNADKVKIKAADGSYNEVTDARALQTDENDTTGSGAIYALCDLNLLGSGSLVVKASYNNGLHTKDDLKIKNLTLKVTAPNNAIKGNDSLTVESGNIIAISTSGDALKTENSDISSKGNLRGTITISGGTLELYAGCDGIDASYDVVISGTPNITINTNSYSSYTIDSLKTTKTSSTSRMGGRPGMGDSSTNTAKSAESSKGIKADNEITVSGGVIAINCKDDGIHANSDVALENGATPLGNITISGGSITIVAADDGIHADGTLQIDGGYIDIVDSHEGLEGHYINVGGGEIHVYATDDGVNATGSSSNKSDGLITVTGGQMYVEVGGNDVDGIDSNGSYKQTGGIVVVSNPTADRSGNMSATDVDGTITVTGGIIVALDTVPSSGGGMGGRPGMGGMGASTALPSGYVTLSGSRSAGTHTVTYGGVTGTFTLKKAVSSGWFWADGDYTLN